MITMAAMGLAIDLAYSAAALALSPVLLWKRHRQGKLATDWSSRFGHGPKLAESDRPTVLIHAVSVGEIHAIGPLVHRIARPDSAEGASIEPGADLQSRSGPTKPCQDGEVPLRLVISATTDTGFERAGRLYGSVAEVVRFPFDFSRSVGRFLDRIRPDVVALTELEVWPNFTQACARRQIPVGVINGRLTERSFRGYRRFRWVVEPMFGRLDFVGCQTEAIVDRFAALGVDRQRITVTDNLKWDQAILEEDVPGSGALATAMGIDRARPLVTAGSTGPGEEAMLIQGCPEEVQLLLAPRKQDRFDEVAGLVPGMVRRSACPDGSTRKPDGQTRFFLLDTLGELQKGYALADVVMVGRSFLGLYGSNVLEPVALGKPAVIGPHYGDFQDIVDALRAEAGIEVSGEPWPVAEALLADSDRARLLAENGRKVILSRQGAGERSLELIRRAVEKTRPQPPAPA